VRANTYRSIEPPVWLLAFSRFSTATSTPNQCAPCSVRTAWSKVCRHPGDSPVLLSLIHRLT